MSPPPFYRASPNLPVAKASFHKPAAIPRAPIVNPYDKLTQPEFDAFISDITGALRDALGYRADPPPKPKARTQWHIPASPSSEAPDASYDEDADVEMDDSFAEVKARREATGNAKGKGRDPREGPGLGKGERGAPIEIDLDSEEEEEVEEDEEEWEEEDEDGVQTSDEEEEEENALRNGESSAHAHARYRKYAVRRDDEAEEEYEEEDADVNGPVDAIEVISDDEQDDAPHVNGHPPQAGDDSGEEYPDEEDVNTTSLLVKPTQVFERDYSDNGEETGSESENEDAAGSSPPRHAADPHFQPDHPRHALDDMFGEEDDELDEGVGSSPPRGAHEPEIIDVGSDDEEEEEGGDEEEDLREDEYAPEDEAEQDEGADLRIQPQLYIQREEDDAEDGDDVLPGSSPILSSPVEPMHSIQSENHDVFTVEDFEDDGQVDDSHDQSKPFDWDHPPAFARGLPASGAGHLATPVEEEDVADSEEYPQLETFGTSDLLPTYKNLSQTQAESEAAESLQLDYNDGVSAEPTSPNLAQEYSVEEVEEDYRDLEDLEDLDAYTTSPSSFSHHFIVEEPFTDGEPDDHDMHIDVFAENPDVDSALDDLVEATYREGEPSADVRQEQADIQDPILSEDARELEATLDSSLNGQVDSEIQLIEPQISVPQNGDGGRLLDDSIPMPVLADPTVDDPSALQSPTTPPRVPMILSLPGSHFLLSPINTSAGQPTPVSLPVPASMLKAMHMRQDSGLFTPNSETPSAATTPHPADHSTQADIEPAVSKTEYFDMENAEDQSQNIPDFSAQMTEMKDAEESLNPLNDGEAIVDDSADVDEATEQTDNAVVVQEESNEDPDAAAEVDAAELQQLAAVGETSPGVTSAEELVDDLTEEVTVEAALPRDEETAVARDEEPVAAQDEEPAVVAEVNGVTSPSYSEGMDDHVVTSESQAGESDLAIADGEGNGSTRALSPSGVPTEMSLTTKTAPVDDPSTPDESPDVLEQAEIPQIPVPSLEEKTEGDDGTSQDTELDDMDEMSIDNIELQYPSEPDVEVPADVEEEVEPVEVEEVEAVEVERAESVGTGDDVSEESETDADGDDDPDYEESSASSVVDEEPVVDEKPEPAVDPASIDSPGPSAQDSALMEQEPELPAEPSQQTDVSIPEGVPSVEVEVTPNGHVEEPAEVNDAFEEKEDAEGVDKVLSSVDTNGSTSQQAPESIDAEVKPEAVADTPDSPTQAESPLADSTSLKRKREYGSLTELASTTSNLGKVAESRLSRPYKSNGKGKAKEEYVDNDDASSTSSASSAARMLNPGSRATSRASSVASIRSTKSSLVPPESSPSVHPRMNSIIRVTRPTPKLPPPPPPPPPPPLMHAHSHNRTVPHHHHAPSLSRQPTQQRLIQRTPSRSNTKEEMPPTPSTSSTSSTQIPALPRAAPAAGSPITRSNCRYHKISLPKDDENKGGPRVCFLVPGCSLGDRELMKAEDIQDMGNATMEEGERMVQDLDSLHFSSYLIGILRQLVGVDLLREQEVYYLPPANGEEAPRKPRRREKSKLRISSAGSFASEGSAMSPGVRSPASISSRAPLSAAGSSSTASVQARRRKRSDRGSPTPSSTTRSEQGGEPTDDESPNAKRIRAAEAEGVAAAASGSPLRTRRSKRMDKEAAEYKPEGLETVEESSEEEGKGQRRKKKRGLKRGRQSEAVPAQEGGGEERKTKKLKTHESNGSSTA